MARQTMTQQRRRPSSHPDDPMTECARVCRETVTYCLEQGGDHVEPDHIKAMLDCADICTWTATLHDRRSDFVDQAMELCAAACKACEESCEAFAGDRAMQACADACRACHEHCSP